MFAVKSKFMVGVATSVVATSTVLGASVVLTGATAVDPGIPPVVVVVVMDVPCSFSSVMSDPVLI
jgi:hypothetical protein